MITFKNGHQFDFGCASGALGFNGDGWWFEQPSRWVGGLRPEEFTIIIKTLTYCPRTGNYVWWRPWECCRLLEDGGVVNAFGLTNRGYRWWMDKPYRHICDKGYNVILSVMPNNVHEAAQMMDDLNNLNIVGVQLNLSCPNVDANSTDFICEITKAALRYTRHPVILKLSYQNDYVSICKSLDGELAAYELINSVPFKTVFPHKQSPLKAGGGVSGRPIKKYAEEALAKVKAAGVKTPIISGGGIESLGDVVVRERLGAQGWVFGSIFMRRPALPNLIVEQYRATYRN